MKWFSLSSLKFCLEAQMCQSIALDDRWKGPLTSQKPGLQFPRLCPGYSWLWLPSSSSCAVAHRQKYTRGDGNRTAHISADQAPSHTETFACGKCRRGAVGSRRLSSLGLMAAAVFRTGVTRRGMVVHGRVIDKVGGKSCIWVSMDVYRYTACRCCLGMLLGLWKGLSPYNCVRVCIGQAHVSTCDAVRTTFRPWV